MRSRTRQGWGPGFRPQPRTSLRPELALPEGTFEAATLTLTGESSAPKSHGHARQQASAPSFRAGQPLAQFGPASLHAPTAHRNAHGLLLAHQHDQPLAPRHTRVEQVAREHGVVL